MIRAFRVFECVLAGALLLACACSSLNNCPEGGDAQLGGSEGETNKELLFYESGPWNHVEPFPAKTQRWFEHGLGVTPLDITTYLSFREVGTNDREAAASPRAPAIRH